MRWLRAIADRAASSAPNIAVRGAFTRGVLYDYGFRNTRVIGCPSLFLNPSKTLGRSIAERAAQPIERVAAVAGHPNWRHLSRIERSLAQLVTETHGAYVCQGPLPMLRLGRGEVDDLDDDELAECSAYLFGDDALDAARLKTWALRHAIAFVHVPAWLEYLRRFDFVVGTRIHGVALGLQAGVPGLCVVFDSRTRELCETMAVPHIRVRDYARPRPAELGRMFEERFDAQRFDSNRRRLAAAYCAFLESNGLRAATRVRALCADGA